MARPRVEGQVRASMPGKSILLTASAGSGKTYALVRRLIHLLAAGSDPGSVAAITFTEKAAAQMKERLLGTLAEAVWDERSLEEIIGLEKSDLQRPLTRMPDEIFSGLTSRPESLKVSTIHAFCHALLKRFPLEAGVPAGFSVLDDSEIPLRRDAAAGECLEATMGTDLEADCWTLFDAGFDIPKIKELLVLGLDKRSQLFMLEVRAGGPEALDNFLINQSLEHRAQFEAALKDPVFSEQAGRLAAMLEKYGGNADGINGLLVLQRIETLSDFSRAFNSVFGLFYTWKDGELKLKDSPPLTKTAIKKSLSGALKGKALDAEVSTVAAEYGEMHSSFAERLSAIAALHDGCIAVGATASFLRLFRKTEGIYAARNHGEGAVDFDDLEIYACRLLSGPDAPQVLNRLDEKVLHYLVDEFQDTGELQWAILERLGSEAFSGMGAEGRGAATFFAVGDKKQSIYRFRKANYKLMDTLKEEMESRIAPDNRDFPVLDYNFRSAPEILNVVDEVFGALMEDYAPSQPYRSEAGGSVKLRVASGEAEALAEEIEDAFGLPVWDGERFRPAAWGDMAVLIRSRTALPEYEQALRARGIGFKVVGGIGFFYQEEVQAVLNILRYLNNKADNVSYAGFLKSPLFGLTDGAVEQIIDGAALGGICPRAQRMLGAAEDPAAAGPVGELVETIIRASGAVAAFGQSGGPAAVLNLEKLIATAHDFDARGGVGLQDFVEWVAAYREKADMATADLELPRFRDFVTIMTVHAAKGLEFPVVFLPGTGRKRNSGLGPLLIGEKGSAFPLALNTSALLGKNQTYDALKNAEAGEQDRENIRLLYVAMTRAKDHLVILAEDKKPAKGSWLEKIYAAALRSLFGGGLPSGPCESLYPQEGRQAMQLGDVMNEGEHEMALPDLQNLAPLPTPEVIRWLSPSGMVSHVPEEADTLFDSRLRGVIIHRCLEIHGKTGSFSIQAAASAEEGFAALEPRTQTALITDIEKALAALFTDPEFKALLSPGENKYFELPLLLERGDEIIYGHADLVIVEGRKARVIDYKTGFTETPAEELTEAYRPQLEAYCEAVKEAFGAEGVEAELLLVDKKKLLNLV